jgi:hypothetical protein
MKVADLEKKLKELLTICNGRSILHHVGLSIALYVIAHGS